MTPEVPLVPDLLSEGRHLRSLQLGMDLPWTSLQLLIQERPPGIDHSRTGRMKTNPAGRCRLPNTSCSARQLLHQKGPSSSTQPSPGGQLEPLSWILGTERCRTGCPGWINLPSQTLWHPQPGLCKALRKMKKLRSLLRVSQCGLVNLQAPDCEAGVSSWALPSHSLQGCLVSSQASFLWRLQQFETYILPDPASDQFGHGRTG